MMLRPAELATLIEPIAEVLRQAGIALVVIAHRDGNLERWYATEAAAAMLGYTLDELDPIPPLDMITPEQRPLVMQLAASFRAGHPIPPAMEIAMLHKDGHAIPIEVVMSYQPIPEGAAYVMTLRDTGTTESSHLSLLEADRIGLVGALAAGFAHEINNPLTSVLLNLRSLRKQLVSNLPPSQQPPALRCLDDVTIGAERIASNVRALQTLVTRSGTQSLDLAAVVSSALRLAAPTLEPVAQVIRQMYPTRPVVGEESRIGQAVLAMLLFASSGFDPENTVSTNRIHVTVAERQDTVVVEVSDNGRDLTPEEARRAFDPFNRAHVRGAGVGLGLGVARSVATTLGGGVTLAPRVGGGAVITMQLPAADRANPSA